MNTVLFILAWIILGIISLTIISKVAKRTIEENENIETCSNEELVYTMHEFAEAEKEEGSHGLERILKHPILVNLVAIALWPLLMPLSLFGWSHYKEW